MRDFGVERLLLVYIPSPCSSITSFELNDRLILNVKYNFVPLAELPC